MRAKCVCFFVSLILLLGVVWLTKAGFSTYAFAQSTANDEAAIVQIGIDQARSSLRSGKGSVNVSRWSRKHGGGELQIDREYAVAFRGEKFKIRVEDTYVKNDTSEEQQNGYQIRPGDKIVKELRFDGSKATVYLPDQNRAVTGNTELGSVGAEFHSHSLYVTNGSLGLPSLGATSGDRNAIVSAFPDEQLQTTVVGRERIDGKEYIVRELNRVLPLEDAKTLVLIRREWVDPDQGFSVPRVRVWGEGGLLPERTLLTAVDAQYRQFDQGRWAVSKMVIKEYRMDAGTTSTFKSSESVVTYADDFGYDVEVTDSDLNLPLPSGTTVVDEILDSEYTVP